MDGLAITAGAIVGYGALSYLDYAFRKGLRIGTSSEFREDAQGLIAKHTKRNPNRDRQIPGLDELKQQYNDRDRHLHYDLKLFGRWVPDPLLLPWRIVNFPHYLMNGRKGSYNSRPKA